MKTQFKISAVAITFLLISFSYGQDDFNIKEGNSYRIYFGIENFVEGKVLQIDSVYIRIQQPGGVVKIKKSFVKRVTLPSNEYIEMLSVAKQYNVDMNSIENTKNCTITYYDNVMTDSRTKKIGLELTEIEDVNKVVFLKSDSMIVTDESSNSHIIALEHSKQVRIKRGNYGGSGILIGCFTGVVAGVLIYRSVKHEGSVSSYGSNFNFDFSYAIIPLSAIAGMLLGGLTGMAIPVNDDIELQQFKVSERKAKIMKFLRENN